jgi:hypothetical protein
MDKWKRLSFMTLSQNQTAGFTPGFFHYGTEGNLANKIHLYREQIIAKYPLFTTMRVVVPRYGFFLEPWRDWERGETPLWWRSYNNVKHERDAHFSDANLDNVLWAVAGLFCLVLYFYQPALYANELKPWTRLFALPKEPGYRMLEQNYGLPDFG